MHPDDPETPSMDRPSYPASTDSTSDEQPAPTTGWAIRLAIAGVVVVIAVFVILHLTGVVGPGTG